MGSVRFNRQRSAWFIDYVAANGQRIRQSVGPGQEGKRLAKKVLQQREAEAQLSIHNLPASRTPEFAAFAEDWLLRIRSRVKPKTLELYTIIVRYHLTPYFGQMRLGGITRRDVEAYLTSKREHTRPGPDGQRVTLAPNTVNCTLTVLKMVLNDAVEQGVLSANPAAHVRPLRPPEQEDGCHMLQPEQIARLLEVANDPWRTVYLLAIHTGLRRGELLGLRWRDVDLRARILHVRRTMGRVREEQGRVLKEGTPKSRAARRVVDLSPTATQALLDLPAGDDPELDYVFRSRMGGPIDGSNLRVAFRRHLALAGLRG